MKTLNSEKQIWVLEQETLAEKLIKNVDNPVISDKDYNTDLYNLCQINQIIDK